ncbi:MAG: helix-turn-helix domain-containing protein, partial [Candidatus Binatia bacterium]
LPGNSDNHKYEFLADVSSFANSSGGDILYGVREKREQGQPTGIPEAADGLNEISADADKLRLENIIRDGLAPRVPNVSIVSITGFKDGPIILVRIPNSWISPHMINKKDSRFYSRNSAGKYPLDVAEIRSAFALSESLPDKIRRFRDDRVARIVAEDTPVKLSGSGRVILHVLPIAALDPTTHIDTASLTGKFLSGIYLENNDFRHNFDGYLMSRHPQKSPIFGSYVQVFRTGAIEAVDSCSTRPYNGKKFIAGNYFVKHVSSALNSYLEQEEELQLQPPLFVMLSLVGVMGYKMYSGTFSDENHPVDRDTLFLPDIIVESYGTPATTLFRPAFDALWQAGGFERSPSYDKNENWKKTY